jgi:quinol-cytochrome oxidoreductase complex cytochrome b subunit
MPPWAIAFAALWIAFLVFFVVPVFERAVRKRILATPLPRRHLWPIGIFTVALVAMLVLPPTGGWTDNVRPGAIVGSAVIVAIFIRRYVRDRASAAALRAPITRQTWRQPVEPLDSAGRSRG